MLEMPKAKDRVELSVLTSRTCCSTVLPSVPDLPPINARYLISIFVVSVFPAPLSPLTKIDWLPCSLIIDLIHEDQLVNFKHDNFFLFFIFFKPHIID